MNVVSILSQNNTPNCSKNKGIKKKNTLFINANLILINKSIINKLLKALNRIFSVIFICNIYLNLDDLLLPVE